MEMEMDMDMAMYMDLWIYRSMDLYPPYQNSSLKSLVKNSLTYAIWGEVWQYHRIRNSTQRVDRKINHKSEETKADLDAVAYGMESLYAS